MESPRACCEISVKQVLDTSCALEKLIANMHAPRTGVRSGTGETTTACGANG